MLFVKNVDGTYDMYIFKRFEEFGLNVVVELNKVKSTKIWVELLSSLYIQLHIFKVLETQKLCKSAFLKLRSKFMSFLFCLVLNDSTRKYSGHICAAH